MASDERNWTGQTKSEMEVDGSTDDMKEHILAFQNYLQKEYQTNYLKVNVSPLLSDKSKSIYKMYVPVEMALINHNDGTASNTSKHAVHLLNEIFKSNRQSVKNIYITASAGMGKTTLCRRLLSTWCEIMNNESDKVRRIHILKGGDPLDLPDNMDLERLKREWREIDEMNKMTLKHFSFVFYVSLRNAREESSIEEMIINQLLEGKHTETFYHVLKYMSDKCLYIADGLDEWISPEIQSASHILPERKYPCTTVFTSRPWTLTSIFQHPCDKGIEIKLTGLNEKQSAWLVDSVCQHMHIPSKSLSPDEFELEQKRFIKNPMLLKFLVCVWIDSGKLNDSKTELYCDIIEWNLRVLVEKSIPNIPDTDVSPHLESGLPQQLLSSTRPNCRRFAKLLRKLGHFSFDRLTRSIHFNDRDLSETYGMSKTEINICHKLGLRSLENEDGYSTMKTNMSVSCIHRTFQEFFAAIHVFQNPNKLLQLFTPGNNEPADFDAMSFTLPFISGFDNLLVNDITEIMYNNVPETFPQCDKQRRKRKLEQDVVHSCLNEMIPQSKRSKTIPLKCLYLHTTDDLHLVHYINPESVESLSIYTDEIGKYRTDIKRLNRLHALENDRQTTDETDVDASYSRNELIKQLVQKQHILETVIICDSVLRHSDVIHLLCNIGTLTSAALVNVQSIPDSCNVCNRTSTLADYSMETLKTLNVSQSKNVICHITSAPALEYLTLHAVATGECEEFITLLSTSRNPQALCLHDVILNDKSSKLCMAFDAKLQVTLKQVQMNTNSKPGPDQYCEPDNSMEPAQNGNHELHQRRDIVSKPGIEHTLQTSIQKATSDYQPSNEDNTFEEIKTKLNLDEKIPSDIRQNNRLKQTEPVYNGQNNSCLVTRRVTAASSWSAYDYSCKHIDNLCKHYINALNACDLEDVQLGTLKQEHLKKRVVIMLLGETDDLVYNKLVDSPEIKRSNLEQYVTSEQSCTEFGATVYIAFQRDIDSASQLCKLSCPETQRPLVVLIKDSTSTGDNTTMAKLDTLRARTRMTTAETITTDVDDLLERHAFDIVHHIATTLNAIVDVNHDSEDHTDDTSVIRSGEMPSYISKQRHSEFHREEGITMENIRGMQSTNRNMKTIESVESKIKWMYRRSKVPETEMPPLAYLHVEQTSQKKPCIAALAIDNVVAIGERFETTRVYLDDTLDEDATRSTLRMVENRLKKEGVHNYTFHSSSKKINHLASAGDQVGDDKIGTLGGLAWKYNESDLLKQENSTNESESSVCASAAAMTLTDYSTSFPREMHALVSRHVAQFYWNLGDKIQLGTKLRGRLVGPFGEGFALDIAAVLIENKDSIHCDQWFRNEKGIPAPCVLFDFTTKDIKEIADIVHIWGATTKPGLGEIDDENYNTGNYPLLSIKARGGDKFCKEGDSGAIVIAESREKVLYAIGMIIGQLGTKGPINVYSALRLQDGLDWLSKRHGGRFTLASNQE